MSTQFISPVGRLVQGGMTLQPKTDNDGKPVLDKETGQQVQECFLAIAIRKDDPNLGQFYNLFVTQAKASFPHLFDANGTCTHPRFAWKIQDGDGTDQSGKSVADKPGFAGHYIFKMATRYAPRCFHHGKYDPSQQIQNPDDVIKRGYFVRVSGTIDGNGVQPDNRQAVPGLYVSPNLVELVAFGEEIVSGPDASKVFGGAALGALPPGASQTPQVASPGGPGGGLAAPALPGQAPAAAPANPPRLPGQQMQAPPANPPQLPGQQMQAPTPPGAGLGPPPAAAPSFQMQPSAQGATREQLNALGWTDDQLLAAGHMVRVG